MSGKPTKGPLQDLFVNMSNKQKGSSSSNGNHDYEEEDEEMEEMSVAPAAGAKGSKKRISVERIYQKKTQLEHILLRPDTYIGSVEHVTQSMWVYDKGEGEGAEDGMVLREITYVPGLYKIFDEILVNAADNKQRDKTMDTIKVEIDPENNKISIYNNGKGIPIIEHKDEKMFVPSLIFGHLLTSSNYNDEEKKVTGGRNGYGAKLCNIFSTKFTVETASKEYKKIFKQTWENNMTKTKEPKIGPSTDDFTKITFHPDLSKFKMEKLDRDTVALLSRRAYDVAGATRGVKVFLNGKRLAVKCFKDMVDQYLKGREDDMGNPLKCAHETVSDRWEIAIAMSDKGFQQVSFCNSIATTKGGRHVDHVTDQVVSKLADVIKKKNKAGVNVKPFQLKTHLWVFVNCLIENPSFDSQTKENMTLQAKSFGSKCTPTDKFFQSALKIGIVESIMTWVKFKAETQLATKCHSKKHSRLKGIPKLEDANDAGTKNSVECTLILTEGDSAKSLVVAGLSVIGRDKYGVFPLRGKMLNVREATHKQIFDNAEITNLLKIMGLQYKKKYETMDDLKTLRYGRLMIMTDQDQDGSHIKGLLINFIHHNWPSLLKLPFLEQFITPIVKVSKGNVSHSFYSLPEFEEWKKATSNWSAWKVKYYKGLGTSTAQEAKEYFSDLHRHRILFKYQGQEDDHAVNLGFSKKMVERRKDWLTIHMEDKKRRRELGLPDVYLYAKDTKVVTYKDFINKELILFSNLDNERSIPSLMDGLKPGQRKVLFTCFKRNDKREVKVAQLAGSVGEHSAYHHGEASLMSTIIGLAQNFVGSNNINLLQPLGQFGTRLQGGKDAASPRYIFTMLSPLARRLFPVLDDPLLNHLFDDNQKIEPEYYVPIIPMVLVNGAEGIGTGWSTKVPNYDPRDLADNIKRMIRGDDPETLKPWYKGFRGEIDQVESQRFVVNGEIAELDSNKVEITELPIRLWTQKYKEDVLELMLHGNDKLPSFISDYKEYHTDATIRFVITLPESNLAKAEHEGIHKQFKIQSTFTTSSMVLFDHNGCLRRYESPEDILKEFFGVRLDFYRRRKVYMEGMLEAEAGKLMNQARFILEKINGTLKMENVKRKDFIQMLVDHNFDSDPVKAWRIKNGFVKDDDKKGDSESQEEEEAKEMLSSDYDFDYLVDMTMRSMLKEKVEELMKKRDIKKAELDKLKKTSAETLWEDDIESFLQELDKVEQLEREAFEQGKQGIKLGKAVKPVKGRGNKNLVDSKPSTNSRRMAPRVDFEGYKKKEIEGKAKGKGRKKSDDDPIKEEKGEDASEAEEEDVPLAQRIGTSPEIIAEKRSQAQAQAKTGEKGKKPLKQTTLNFKPLKAKNEEGEKSPKKRARKTSESPVKKGKKGKKAKNPWSESESDEEDDLEVLSDSEDEEPVVYKPRETTRRAATKAKFNFDDSIEDEVEEEEATPHKPRDHEKEKGKNGDDQNGGRDDLVSFDTTAESTVIIDKEKDIENDRDKDMQQGRTGTKKFSYSEIDSDDDLLSPPKVVVEASRKRTSEELFDSVFTAKKAKVAEALSSGTASSSRHQSDSDGNSDGDLVVLKEHPKPKPVPKKTVKEKKEPAKKRAPVKAKAKKPAFSDDSEDDSHKKKKQVKKSSKKAMSSDEDEEDQMPKKKGKKTKKDSSSDEDMAPLSERMARTTTGRQKKPVSYKFDSSDDE